MALGLIIITIKDTPLFLIFSLFSFVFVVISTTMDQPAHQPRISRPTAKLIDANNLERAPLAYQHNAIAAENARVEAGIVEALQFMKCLFHRDLISREVCTSWRKKQFSKIKSLMVGME